MHAYHQTNRDSATANQNALDSQTANRPSGIVSASSQEVQNTSTSQQSQHTSANQHSHTTSTANRQSVEERSHAVSTTIQQLTSKSHAGHHQTGSYLHENVNVSKTEDESRSRIQHLSSDYQTRIALMGKDRSPAITHTQKEQTQNMNMSKTEETSRNMQSRVRHLSSGYQARIALMGDDHPSAIANIRDNEQAGLYNRLYRQTDNHRTTHLSGARHRATASQRGGFVKAMRMTANEQTENLQGQDQSTAGRKQQWYEKAEKSCSLVLFLFFSFFRSLVFLDSAFHRQSISNTEQMVEFHLELVVFFLHGMKLYGMHEDVYSLNFNFSRKCVH